MQDFNLSRFFWDGVIEHFIMRRNIKLKNLLLTYCTTVGIKYEETRFFVDGYFFNHERTPNELGMQDYELIAAMGEQLGGGAGAA
ncbi:putative small ubiquitin-related modifier 8 isoform X2 [Diospyros lotus]|uniref:putative small ubiquitin-related modifier 8 isoform X2 n=1 Tax=Diospyros lotus TaxID=55363 RepID=UPI00224DE32A|nr:putative small ubiquitin-related modifier 8 isoform X2 [Diospyros lotus]